MNPYVLGMPDQRRLKTDKRRLPRLKQLATKQHCSMAGTRPLSHSETKTLRGFSLIELVIVTLVLAILAGVAMPMYAQYAQRSRRADAFQALATVNQAQERYRSNAPSYANSLDSLGIPSPRHYDLSLGPVTANGVTGYGLGYLVTAKPKADSPQIKDTDCAVIAVQILGGNLSHLSTNSANQDSSSTCWPK